MEERGTFQHVDHVIVVFNNFFIAGIVDLLELTCRTGEGLDIQKLPDFGQRLARIGPQRLLRYFQFGKRQELQPFLDAQMGSMLSLKSFRQTRGTNFHFGDVYGLICMRNPTFCN